MAGSEERRKSVVITGASRGFGLALFKHFTAYGWKVAPVVRANKDAAALKNIGGDSCFPIIGDITDDGVQVHIAESLKRFEAVEVLVNNAGIDSRGVLLKDASPHEVLSLFDVHCLGVLRATRAVMPLMDKGGIIINVSSRFGSISKVSTGELDGIECSYAYRIAKAAQNMLTQCLSREFKDTGPRICAVHPGRLKTGMASADADRTPEEAAAQLYEMLPNIEHGRFYDLFGGVMDW